MFQIYNIFFTGLANGLVLCKVAYWYGIGMEFFPPPLMLHY